MKRWLLISLLVAAVGLTACSDDPAGPELGQDFGDPPPVGASGAAVLEPLPEDVTSRRFDLRVAVADSGDGIATVAVWARPAGGDWLEAFTVADTDPHRFTVPEDGPFGHWEFAAQAIAADGTREEPPEIAEATTLVPVPIILVDRQGESWDITHAVLRYGLAEHSWEFGLGRIAIQAIVDPAMSCPGDPDYPHPDNLAVVFGVAVDGEARAYKLGDLSDREVADDTIAGTHLAVTY